jgi:hypothetical protein
MEVRIESEAGELLLIIGILVTLFVTIGLPIIGEIVENRRHKRRWRR